MIASAVASGEQGRDFELVSRSTLGPFAPWLPLAPQFVWTTRSGSIGSGCLACLLEGFAHKASAFF